MTTTDPSVLSAPHLHTHAVITNLGRGPEGRFSALDGRGFYAHAAASGALYHAQLRFELTSRLGVAWGALRSGRADITGIGPEARAEFSQRAAAIAAHLAERGLTGRRARQIAGHATRPERRTDVAPEDLRQWWHDRARSVGLGPERLGTVFDRVPRRFRSGIGCDPDRAVLDGLGQGGGRVARRDVVRAMCSAMPGGAPAAEVEQAADRLLATLVKGREQHPSSRAARVPEAERDVRGVGEPRYVLDVRGRDGTIRARQSAELARLLAARGMEPLSGMHRAMAGRDRGDEVGLGLG